MLDHCSAATQTPMVHILRDDPKYGMMVLAGICKKTPICYDDAYEVRRTRARSEAVIHTLGSPSEEAPHDAPDHRAHRHPRHGLLVAPLTAEAQPATHVYRIGRLSAGPPRWADPDLEAFRQGLRDLGYVEGQNLVMESRYAEGKRRAAPRPGGRAGPAPGGGACGRGTPAIRAAHTPRARSRS